MLTPTWPTGLRVAPAQVLRALDPVATPNQPSAERDLLAALAGRTVNAVVIERADDGHGIVDIGGRHITIAADLPPSGTSVTLRFGGAEAAATPGAAALLARAGGLGLALPAAADAAGGAAARGASLVELGSSALTLGRLSETPLTPLPLGAVGADIEHPAEWSAALAHLLRDSGTFYESHLAAWTRGNYALEDVRREPQAGATLATPGHAAGAGAGAPAYPQLAITDSPRAGTVQQADAGAPAPAQGLPEEWRPVIREQLHALENQALPFSLEPWPGQRADMVIARDDGGEEGQAGAAAAAPGWKTTLKLELPQLGSIAATLTLKGDRLWLDLAAPADSAALLDHAGTSLGNAMHAAGVQLVRTRVRHDAD